MMEINFETARHNMIEQQIRPWNVIDPVALEALETIPRENFVADELKEAAFSDVELPIGHGQLMLAPKIEAKILQAVQVKETDKVLEIGTGSGYLTALLAHLADTVITVELYEDLSELARKRVEAEGIKNVRFVVADTANGYSGGGPYDVIVITGSVPELPESFKQSLKIGGRLFAVTGESPVMEAILITRVSEKQFSEQYLFETDLQPLEHVNKKSRFIF